MASVDPHTVKAFDDDLEQIRALVAELGGLAEAALADSAGALLNGDEATAARVIASDAKIDEISEIIERDCIRLIALRAPMADDLRQVLAAFKIAVLIERMGDCARGVAEQVARVDSFGRRSPFLILKSMSTAVGEMVRSAMDAFVAQDVEGAIAVCNSDDEVDALNDQLFRELLEIMSEHPSSISPATALLLASKKLERIGDHASSIARVVHFSVTGNQLPPVRYRRPENMTNQMGLE